MTESRRGLRCRDFAHSNFGEQAVIAVRHFEQDDRSGIICRIVRELASEEQCNTQRRVDLPYICRTITQEVTVRDYYYYHHKGYLFYICDPLFCPSVRNPKDAVQLPALYHVHFSHVVLSTLGVGGGASSVPKILSQKRLVTPKPFS